MLAIANAFTMLRSTPIFAWYWSDYKVLYPLSFGRWDAYVSWVRWVLKGTQRVYDHGKYRESALLLMSNVSRFVIRQSTINNQHIDARFNSSSFRCSGKFGQIMQLCAWWCLIEHLFQHWGIGHLLANLGSGSLWDGPIELYWVPLLSVLFNWMIYTQTFLRFRICSGPYRVNNCLFIRVSSDWQSCPRRPQ